MVVEKSILVFSTFESLQKIKSLFYYMLLLIKNLCFQNYLQKLGFKEVCIFGKGGRLEVVKQENGYCEVKDQTLTDYIVHFRKKNREFPG